MKNFILFCVFFSTFASAKYTWYLPVDGQFTNQRTQKILVKIKNKKCKKFYAFLNNQKVKLYRSTYPNEFYGDVKLIMGKNIVKLIFDNKKCRSKTRVINRIHISRIGIADELVKQMGALNPSDSETRSPFWEDSMWFLSLIKYLKYSTYKVQIKDYLSYYFQYIEDNGMKRMDHPDRVPLVMASILYNSELNADYNEVRNRYLGFLNTIKLNQLGLVDHMGNSWPKRIGSRLILRFLGDPNSVWADSMMMYVLPTIMFGYYSEKPSVFKFGLDQLERMITILQQDSGLFKHTYDYKYDRYRPYKRNAYWLRANGWAVATLAKALMYTDKNTRMYQVISSSLRKALLKLIEIKDPIVNVWRTVLLSDNKYQDLGCHFNNDFETSGSSLVAWSMAIAIDQGVLESSYKKDLLKIYDGIKSFISQSNSRTYLNWMSNLTNAHGSACGYEWFYKSNDKNHSYGIGPFLMLTAKLEEMDI